MVIPSQSFNSFLLDFQIKELMKYSLKNPNQSILYCSFPLRLKVNIREETNILSKYFEWLNLKVICLLKVKAKLASI